MKKHHLTQSLSKKIMQLAVFLLMAMISNAQCWHSVTTGQEFAVGIGSDQKLWVWGRNLAGNYGNGTTNPNTTYNPVQVGTSSAWVTAAATFGSVAAIQSNGTLWAWGQNTWGELGNNTMPTPNYNPTQIGTLTNWTNIVAGKGYASFYSIKNGALWAWGSNSPNGQLGNNSVLSVATPIQIGTATDWAAVYPGINFTIAIKTNGTLWVWGSNSGVYGNGTTEDSIAGRSPMQVGTDTDWKMASGGSFSVHAIKNNGTLWAWGANNSGTFGNGTTIGSTIPVQIGTATDWLTISDSGVHTVALKTNGTLWTWGTNTNGQLANGTLNNNYSPAQVGTATNWFKIAANGNTYARNTLGEIWAAGSSTYGELGNGTTTQSNVLVKVTGCPAVVATSDSGTTVSGYAGTAVTNVRANDTYNGAAATSINTTLSFVSTTHPGVTLNTSTGVVSVSATVPAGTYTLNYNICAVANPYNCQSGTVTVNVTLPVINAVDNDFSGTPINYTTGGSTASVTPNDTMNGTAVANGSINISLTNGGGLVGVTISNTGVITIPAQSITGTFTLTYSICQSLNPTDCDQASVVVTLFEPVVITPNSVVGVRANRVVQDIAIQTGGKIIITGGFTTYNNVASKYIARLNTDLTLDNTFLATGPTTNNNPYRMRMQSDNKIVMVGGFNNFNGGSNGNGLIRLNADGSVDTAFNSGGTGVTGTGDALRSVGIQADGKILLGGGFLTGFNGAACRNMIRLNANGSVDNTFNFHYTTNGQTQILYGAIYNIVPLTTGKIIITGTRSSLTGGMPDVFRLNADGSLDTTFTTGNTGVNVTSTNCSSCASSIDHVLIQPDGKIVLVGTFNSYNGNTFYKNIVRLNTNGAIDATFNGIGTSTDRAIKDVAYDTASNKLIITGEFTIFNGVPASRIARLSLAGALDTTFSPGTSFAHTPTSPVPYVLKRQGDGKVLIGGTFTTYNGISAMNLTRIQPSVPGGQAKNGFTLFDTDEQKSQNRFADQILLPNDLVIYPNPSDGIFNIDLSGLGNSYTKIEVYNILGSLIYHNNLSTGTLNQIDLSGFQNGYYMAKVSGNAEAVSIKLIKN